MDSLFLLQLEALRREVEIRMKHSVKKGKTISSEVCREKNVLMLHVFSEQNEYVAQVT